jgi:membrane-associated phospholipid phosphatase
VAIVSGMTTETSTPAGDTAAPDRPATRPADATGPMPTPRSVDQPPRDGAGRGNGATTAEVRDRGGIDTHQVAWLVMAVLGLGVFAAITAMLMNHVVFGFDQPLLETARSWQAYAPAWRFISESANIPLIVIGVGLVLVLFFTKHRREAVIVAVVLIAVTAGSEGIKQLVARPRPSGTDPNIPGVVYSFPSGHVLEALTIFGIIAIRIYRSARTPRVIAVLVVVAVIIDAALVAVARVALSAHYPTDVLASAFGGAGVLGIYGLLTHDHEGSRSSDRRPT